MFDTPLILYLSIKSDTGLFINFKNLNEALRRIFIIIKKEKFLKKTIIFSPSAASFDSFKNFEDRGDYFNKLIKKYINE